MVVWEGTKIDKKYIYFLDCGGVRAPASQDDSKMYKGQDGAGRRLLSAVESVVDAGEAGLWFAWVFHRKPRMNRTRSPKKKGLNTNKTAHDHPKFMRSY